MLRFSKRSRITFSNVVDVLPTAREGESGTRPCLWHEGASSNVVEVPLDSEDVELLDEEPEALPRFALPPPRMPPRNPSAVRTMPPTSFRGVVVTADPSPSSSSVSVAPVEIAAAVEIAAQPSKAASFGVGWAAALLAVGALAGFGAALVARPASPDGLAPAVAAAGHAPEAPITQGTTLHFDTALEIDLPVAAPARATAPAARPAAAPSPRVTSSAPKPADSPTLRRDMPVKDVEKLVREQLRTSLR